MDFKTFLEHFDTIAQAPNGIAKLRSLILDLAVRGKLVPQNPEDESSESNLLAMKIHRADWLKEQSDSNQEYRRMLKKLSSLTSPEPPFEIPKSWTCAHLIDLSLLTVDCHNKTAPTQLDGIPLVRTTNIRNGKFRLHDLKFVSEETYQFWSRRCFPQPGDIIFTREAPMGEAAIIPEGMKVCLGQRTMLIRFLEEFVDRNFLLLTLIEPGLLSRISGNAVGMTVKHLRVEDVEQIVIAVPPLAEQKRIVKKVDELMALCDRLQASQENRDKLRQKLRESAIASLMNAETDEELQKSWAIVRDNWHTLSQKPQDVDDLRRSVLQLAYSGKLTKRLEPDISVDTLFSDVKEARELLLRKLRFRDSTTLEKVQPDEELFPIPKEWKWIRIGHAFLISSGTTPSRVKPEYFEGGTEYWVKTTDLNNNIVLSCEEKITKVAIEDCNLKYYPVGTVCVALYGGAGTIGKSGLLGIETTINQSVCGIYPNKNIFPPYLHWYVKLIRPVWMCFAASLRKAPNINAGVVNNMVFPLASFEEQKRIVAKVDELMQMCDRLEESLRQSQQKLEALAASAISHLTL